MSTLSRLRDQALEGCQHPHLGLHLELYGGSGKVAKRWKRMGLASISFEITQGDHFDLNNFIVQHVVNSWIEEGIVGSVWLGTPCSTWSQGLNRWPKCRLRDARHLWGLPNLNPEKLSKLANGNRQARFTYQIIQRCLRLHIPVALENPSRSFLLQTRQFKILAKHKECIENNLTMCAYGARWHKRTKVFTWFCSSQSLCRTCAGRRGICSFTGKPHITLIGYCADKRTPWTSVASTYPTAFAYTAAMVLATAAQDRYTSRIDRFYMGT